MGLFLQPLCVSELADGQGDDLGAVNLAIQTLDVTTILIAVSALGFNAQGCSLVALSRGGVPVGAVLGIHPLTAINIGSLHSENCIISGAYSHRLRLSGDDHRIAHVQNCCLGLDLGVLGAGQDTLVHIFS